MSSPVSTRRFAGRDHHLALRAVAVALFLILGGWLATEMPAWHEGRSVYPMPAPYVLQAHGDSASVALEDRCDDSIEVLRSRSRPQLMLCLSGHAYPLMVSSYASGVPYWPSALLRPWHKDDLVRLRLLGLIFGLLAMLVTARLVQHMVDRSTATLAVLFMSVTPSFLFLNGLLVHYELTPWLFAAAGAWLLVKPTPLSIARAAVAGGLIGLALAANIKALFLIVPLAALYLRVVARPPRPSPRTAAALAAGFVIGVSPLLLGMYLDAGQGVSSQTGHRLSIIADNFRLGRFARETLNLGWFWSDMLMYLDVAGGKSLAPSTPAMVVAFPSLAYCLFQAGRVWVTARGDVLAAACGTLLATFVVVSTLLYDQYPAANYSPLYAVFGVGTAVTVVAVARELGARVGSRNQWSAGLTVAAMIAFAYSSVARGRPSHYVDLPINLAAERDLVSYLDEHREPTTRIVTTTYNMAAVLDSLSRGRITTVQAHHYLACASHHTRNTSDDRVARMATCLESRIVRLFASGDGTLRLVVPARQVPIDEDFAGALPQGIRAAAKRLGATARVEYEARTGAGVTVLHMWRIDMPER